MPKYFLKYGFSLVCLILLFNGAKAQYIDDFASPGIIQVSDNGYGVGTFNGTPYPLSLASVGTNEFFPDDLLRAGLIEKSIWYQFEIPTNRQVKIALKQLDTSIYAQDMGFAVYKNPTGLAAIHNLCDQFPVMNRIGYSENACLEAGVYYVQVSSRQRVMDTVWVEIAVKMPVSPGSDFHAVALDTFWHNSPIRHRIDFDQCSYMLDDAFRQMASNPGEGLLQSSMRFRVDAGYDFYSLSFDQFLDRKDDTVQVLLLAEDQSLPVTSWRIIEDFNLIYYKYGIRSYDKEYGCFKGKTLAAGNYRIILFYKQEDVDNYVNIEIERRKNQGTPHANPLAIPPRFQKTDLTGITGKDTLNCLSRIDTKICPNLNKNLTEINSKGETIHYTHQALYTIERTSEEALYFKFSNSWPWDYRPITKIELYEGDVGTGCNQVQLLSSDGGIYCVTPGMYTLRVLFADSVDYTGGIYEIRMDANPLGSYTYKFNDSLSPENLGDIVNRFPQRTLSVGDVYDNTPQKLWVDNHFETASFQYREFYISSKTPLHLIIDVPTGWYGTTIIDAIIYRGRKSLGTGHQLLDSIDYEKKYFFGFPDTGWYTLVTRRRLYNEPCVQAGKSPYGMIFAPLIGCTNPAKRGAINNPVRYNNGSPLVEGKTEYRGNFYSAPVTHSSGDLCFTYENQDLAFFDWLNQQCGTKWNSNHSLLYAEFEITQASQIEFKDYSMTNLLIQGSVSQNPMIVYDTSAYLSPCGPNYRSYCNLQPGKYTVVMLGWLEKKTKMPLVFIPQVDYPQDHIESYYDAGTLQGTLELPAFTRSCAITVDSSDLELRATHVVPDMSIPNMAVGYSYGSMWYLIKLDGPGILEIQYDEDVNMYQVPDSIDPSLYRNKPGKRSELVGSLSRVFVNNPSSSDVSRFYKGICKNHYYFIRLESNTVEAIATPVLKWTSINVAGNKGDFCNNADITQVTQAGLFTKKIDSRCMTIGEGFGEDGNNMACLPLEHNQTYVSAWHQIHIDPGMRYDVSFSLKSTNNINLSNRLKYRILYGSCTALTPGPCVEDFRASFGFECMEKGDFYLQIIVPEDWSYGIETPDQIEVIVNVTPSANAICKPFDPFRPLASFNFDGHCNVDSVHFRNYSSQGSDIKYLWSFGDGDSSTAKDPVHWYAATQNPQDYRVKLIVENIKEGKKDSIERVVRIRQEALRIDIPFVDTLVQCGSEVTVQAKLNANDGVLFYYYGLITDTTLGDKFTERFIYPKSLVRFIAYASNCVVDTQLYVSTHRRLDRLNEDTLLCTHQVIHLDLAPYKNVTWMPVNIKSPQIDLIDTGHFWVEVEEHGCVLLDSIQLLDRRPVFNHSMDTSVCSVDSMELVILPQYQNSEWDNGQVTPKRWVYGSGNYWVEGQWESCFNRDTVRVSFVELTNPLSEELDSFCKEGSIDIESEIEAQTYIWSTRESTRSISISNPGLYFLDLYTAHCHAKDSIKIVHYPNTVQLGNDTGFCTDFSVQLDAGLGTDYQWWPHFGNSRYYQVKDSGTYGVEKINQYGCYDADTIRIIENCGPYFLMPTAFSPNGDGTNDWLTWSTMDVSEFEIHIYNRWGAEVFSSTDINSSWDGIYQGSPALDGLYIYHLIYGGEDYTGKYTRKSDNGHFLLIR